MKIVIVGAGVVGLHLAKTLSWDGHEISVIDNDQKLVDRASSNFDVMAIRGNGTSIGTLIAAGVKSADLLIAVTSVDEVNIVACMLARELGSPTLIARVRNQEFSRDDVPVKLSNLGITQIIHPELEAAKEVEKMIRYQHAIDLVECAGGKMILAGFRIESDSPIIGKPLHSLTPSFPDITMRLVAISRQGKTVIPFGEDRIEVDDTVYIIALTTDLDKIFEFAGNSNESSHDVMILGGDLVGRLVAQRLEKDKRFNIKLIENDPAKSRTAAQMLQNTTVIRGDEELDIDLMVIEGIDGMGVFAALSDDDENNIVTSLFARHLKVKRTITLISKPDYFPIARAIGLDTTINELLLTSDAILKHIMGSRILSVSTLRGINADIVEYRVGKSSKAAGRKMREINFPKGTLIGAIEHNGEVEVAIGETQVNSGDTLVAFCVPEAVSRLEKLLR